MAQIQPVEFPIVGTATQLKVLVQNFETDAITTGTYYQLLTEDGIQCLQGNYTMTVEQYDAWGQDNSVVDEYVANYLGVTIISE